MIQSSISWSIESQPENLDFSREKHSEQDGLLALALNERYILMKCEAVKTNANTIVRVELKIHI